MLKYSVITFLTLFSSNLLADSQYVIEAKVEDNIQVSSFPPLHVSEGFWNAIKTDTCIYRARITQEENSELLLQSKIECNYGKISTYDELPVFIMKSEGGEAAFVLGDEGGFFKYSVTIYVTRQSSTYIP